MRNEIPQWGWYNGMFLFGFEDALQENPKQTIEDFYNNFRAEKLNNINFPLKNQGTAISLLYMLLVVPREMWETSGNTSFQFTTRSLFTFQTGSSISNQDFLRLMRNSISHANFNMNEEGEYTFWNESGNSQINFEVKILNSNLFQFISEIGTYYINEIRPQG